MEQLMQNCAGLLNLSEEDSVFSSGWKGYAWWARDLRHLSKLVKERYSYEKKDVSNPCQLDSGRGWCLHIWDRRKGWRSLDFP